MKIKLTLFALALATLVACAPNKKEDTRKPIKQDDSNVEWSDDEFDAAEPTVKSEIKAGDPLLQKTMSASIYEITKDDNIHVKNIEDMEVPPGMPSYANPKTYTIVKIHEGRYKVKLSGGTYWSQVYKTERAAKKDIKEVANRIRERFIESGGKSW